MEFSNLPEKGTKEYAIANVLSRPDSLNGFYKSAKLGLEFEDIKDLPASIITSRANIADTITDEFRARGADLNDEAVLLEIREELSKRAFTPIRRSEAVMTAIFNLLGLVFYYAVALGIWGLALDKSPKRGGPAFHSRCSRAYLIR